MPKKQELAREVGRFLGVPERSTWTSGGSKVTADFQRDIGPRLGVPYYGPNKVQHMRAILESVAVPWNSARHSSEDADNPGGNVTKEAYADLLGALRAGAHEEGEFEREPPTPSTPLPELVQRAIRLRRGQTAFRESLLDAFNGACAVTGSTARAVLEAAHIKPFAEGGPMNVSNGLLLRADLHTLFDLRLVAIDSRNGTLLVDVSLRGTEYWSMRGSRVTPPTGGWAIQTLAALKKHRILAGL